MVASITVFSLGFNSGLLQASAGSGLSRLPAIPLRFGQEVSDRLRSGILDGQRDRPSKDGDPIEFQ